MSKSSFTKRKYNPHVKFNTKFEGAAYGIVAKYIETKAINHSLSKGEERENPLIKFLQENLPKIFSVVKGEVVDKDNRGSRQLDVMIYDNSRNIPFYMSNNYYILPAEALLAGIEVKSKLTKEELKTIFQNVSALHDLRPFGNKPDISKVGRSEREKVGCRYFYSVFAYDTDLTEASWAKKEIERIRDVSEKEKINISLIDRFFVFNRGLINPVASMVKETKDNAENLLYFYMHLLQFLDRENSRRNITPYLDYAGKLSSGWEKV